MSARRKKADPVIAAWERLQAADKDYAACDALEEAERKAHEAGFGVWRRVIMIAGDGCLDLQAARRSAKRLPKAQAAAALDAMRVMLARHQRQRREAGLRPYELTQKRRLREWRAAMQGMADTRATTPLGVIAKLKLIATELRDGRTVHGGAILASAIRDLNALHKRGVP